MDRTREYIEGTVSTNSFVLVVGGAGYIGSHMVKLLLQRGEQVVVIDNLSNSRRESVLTPHFIKGDFGNRALLDEIFTRYPIKDVMHFAGFIEVARSVRFPHEFLENNVAKTKVLLDALARHNVQRLVFSSTAAVYGTNVDFEKIPETAPKNPINPYGATKLMAEQLIEGYGQIFGLQSIRFRYFNAAGADPEGQLGECHDPETHLIPLVLQAASGRRQNISVFGTDYPTPDGTCIRDYVHVSDLCDAHYLGLQALRNGGESRIYNLGSENGHSVREVIETAKVVTGCEIPVVHAPRRDGDNARLVADSALVRRELGWVPRYSKLAVTIDHAWSWERKQTEVAMAPAAGIAY